MTGMPTPQRNISSLVKDINVKGKPLCNRSCQNVWHAQCQYNLFELNQTTKHLKLHLESSVKVVDKSSSQ